MVSKRWQKTQSAVQHSMLVMVWGGPLFFLQLDIALGIKLFLAAATVILTIMIGRHLHQTYAKSLVKVFKVSDDTSVSLVQRTLNANFVPFSRSETDHAVRFAIRNQGLTLVVEDYPLNLPIDFQIETIEASKIEIHGLKKENESYAYRLGDMLNEAFTPILNSQ